VSRVPLRTSSAGLTAGGGTMAAPPSEADARELGRTPWGQTGTRPRRERLRSALILHSEARS
jgi:hypothetical protein